MNNLLVIACAAAIFGSPLCGQPLRISAVDPSTGPIAGGTVVTVSGEGLNGASLSFDDVKIKPQVVSDTGIRFTTPAHANGYSTIKLTNGSETVYGEFLYVPPALRDLPPGYITTVAGIGTFTGFYRPATKAEISPYGSPEFDGRGNLYIPEGQFNRVTRVRSDGILEPFAGSGAPPGPDGSDVGDGGPAIQASLNGPRGVTTDSDGNVYISDQGHRVRRVDVSTGIITTIAGGATGGFSGDGGPAVKAQLNNVSHITGDRKGTLYFIDFDDRAGIGRIRKITPDGIISTVAGDGPAGFAGDGGPASLARFNFIFADLGSLALDGSGNLYIADVGNERVRRIDAGTGLISTVYGPVNSPGPPFSVACDAAGDVWIALQNGPILEVGPDGRFLASYGNANRVSLSEDGTPIADVVLLGNQGLTIDPAGNPVYSSSMPSRVRRLNLTTGFVETLAGIDPEVIGDNGPAIATTLGSLEGAIAFLPAGDLLFGDTGHRLLRRIDSSGNVSTYVNGGFAAQLEGTEPISGGTAIQPDEAGNVYIVGGNVFRIDSERVVHLVAGHGPTAAFSGDGGPSTSADLSQPWDIALDRGGNLFIADTNNNRIRRVDANTGIITTVAGSGKVNGLEHYGEGSFCGDGGAATEACLNTPLGVAVDPSGNLFIADTYNDRIRKVDGSGGIATFANMGANKLSFDAAGNLYVASDRVWRFTPDGRSRIIAGSSEGFSGDGGPALAAQISPARLSGGVAIDSEGNLFLWDGGNYRIRAIRYGAVLAPPGAQIQTASGTPQTASLTAEFGSPLDVLVLDSEGNPAGNVRVDFFAPSSGPSCTFSNGANSMAVITDRFGHASATCLANQQQGSYLVTATPLTANNSVRFALTNSLPAVRITTAVNAATFLAGPIAPNEVITILGDGIGPASAYSGPMTTLASGARVYIGGVPAFITYASGTQVNAIAPFVIAGTGSTAIQTEYLGIKGDSITVPVVDSSPGIFTQSYGAGQAWVVNQDGTFNSASNPAPRGSYIAFWATGQGLLDIPQRDGVQPTGPPFPEPVLPVSVSLAGNTLPASAVVFNGLVYSGVIQGNVLIPLDVPSGLAVPLTLTIGGASSRTGVALAIK
jgi:uncharacterized protein (TIGR03437 family)